MDSLKKWDLNLWQWHFVMILVSIDDPVLFGGREAGDLFLGTEGDGLSGQTIADCDYTVKIPMSHDVDSLNVAAASAVAFWELGKKNLNYI